MVNGIAESLLIFSCTLAAATIAKMPNADAVAVSVTPHSDSVPIVLPFTSVGPSGFNLCGENTCSVDVPLGESTNTAFGMMRPDNPNAGGDPWRFQAPYMVFDAALLTQDNSLVLTYRMCDSGAGSCSDAQKSDMLPVGKCASYAYPSHEDQHYNVCNHGPSGSIAPTTISIGAQPEPIRV